jgi:hypothetical protein
MIEFVLSFFLIYGVLSFVQDMRGKVRQWRAHV